MTDDVRALRDTDSVVDRLAARRAADSALDVTDPVLLVLAALVDEVDRTPLPAYDPAFGPASRPARRGRQRRRRSLGAVVAVGFMVSSTGLAAAVTGDPLLPFTFVVRQMSDLAPAPPAVEPDWIFGHHVISSPYAPAPAPAPAPEPGAHPHPTAASTDSLTAVPAATRGAEPAAPHAVHLAVAVAPRPSADDRSAAPRDPGPGPATSEPLVAEERAEQVPAKRSRARRGSPEAPPAGPPAGKPPADEPPPLEEPSGQTSGGHPDQPLDGPPTTAGSPCPDPGTEDADDPAACEDGSAETGTPPGDAESGSEAPQPGDPEATGDPDTEEKPDPPDDPNEPEEPEESTQSPTDAADGSASSGTG